jgi:hypothetical protein
MTQKFTHQVWRFTFNDISGLDTHQAVRFTSSDTRSIDYKEVEFTRGYNPCFWVPEDVSHLLREHTLIKMGGRFIESFRQRQNIMPCLSSLNRWSLTPVQRKCRAVPPRDIVLLQQLDTTLDLAVDIFRLGTASGNQPLQV